MLSALIYTEIGFWGIQGMNYQITFFTNMYQQMLILSSSKTFPFMREGYFSRLLAQHNAVSSSGKIDIINPVRDTACAPCCTR